MTRKEEIFERALDFDGEGERRAYVAGACEGDRKLERAVAALLAAHGEAEDEEFLAALQGGEARVWEGEGSVIGRYKLLQKLGEGGFGVVYMAEQREPVKRRVALKIIKLGMDTKQVIGRFEAERQALALMQHPNIAGVLDAGATASGRPYFVMELVRGIPITEFCDENQLTTEERLVLFQDVCRAVQHAHQKGIIHRDLKPANILVAAGDGGRPHPKIIDFGIAKATQQELTDQTLFTRFEDFVGTPAYMSPEQAQFSQLDIDTRTDVYSLGVLLYELVTGCTPLDSSELVRSGVEEIRRRICDEEPPPPSSRLGTLEESVRTTVAQRRKAEPEHLKKALQHEIDWVIMKAIDKDRNRRYGTAEALAGDIANYLNDEPVEACPPSFFYSLKKTVRRHKAALAVGAAIVASLAIGIVASLTQAIRATKANAEGRELLRNSYLVQARTLRKAPEPGRHFESLDALAKAAQIRPGADLRDEAIAAMALPDARRKHRIDWLQPTDEITAVDSSGRFVATGNSAGAVRICRLADGGEVKSLPEQDGAVQHLDFSPDARRIAVHLKTEAGGEELRVWSLDDLTLEITVPNAKWRSVGFSRDGLRLAVGFHSKKIALYDLHNGEVKQLPCELVPDRIKFGPTGQHVAVLGSGNPSSTLTVIDIEGESALRLHHDRGAMAVDWHPSGRYLASGGGDYNVYLWEFGQPDPVGIMRGHQAETTRVSFHPGGRFLASSSWDGTSRIWDPFRGEMHLVLDGGIDKYLQDGNVQFQLHRDGGEIWEFATGSDCFSRYRLEGETGRKVASLAFSPDSKWLLGSARTTLLWDLATGDEIARDDQIEARSLAFEGNARVLAGGDKLGLRRYELRDSAAEGNVEFVEIQTLRREGINRFALSSGGRTVAHTVMGERDVYLLDAFSGNERDLLAGQPGVSQPVFDPSGRWLATSYWRGGEVRIWDLENIEAEPADLVSSHRWAQIAFSPDGKTMVMATKDGYDLWTPGDWDEPTANFDGRGGPMTFHPDGDFLICPLSLRTIGLVDLGSLEVLAKLRLPLSTPTNLADLAISPDGRYLAVATQQRDIFVWDLLLMRKELSTMNLNWEKH